MKKYMIGTYLFFAFMLSPVYAATNHDYSACPAKKLCPVLAAQYAACKKHDKKACQELVATYAKLAAPRYCLGIYQDHPTPAVWNCDKKDELLYNVVMQIKELKTPDAMKLKKSKLFKDTLDGEVAEGYYDI